MRVVLQRVSSASVTVADAVIAEIGVGLLLLVGFEKSDDDGVLEWMADKLTSLRVFPDAEGRMNRSVIDIDGELLVVSQFTLFGDVRKGRRPSFVAAAPPSVAEPLYDAFVREVETRCRGRVQRGRFGAEMSVQLVNDGPVTLVVERVP